MTNIFSSLITVQYFFRHALVTSPFQHIATYCTYFYHHLYCDSTILCFTANVTLLLRLYDEFHGVWTSCGLRRRFKSCYGSFGFYDHSDIMTKMVWSQGGHIKRRLLYIAFSVARLIGVSEKDKKFLVNFEPKPRA